MKRRRLAATLAAAALAALLGAARATADVHPNAAGGVDLAQAFQVGDVDNINLFNGALTVTVPLGISYPVNGGFAYRLTLVANSNPWLFATTGDTGLPYSSPSPCSNAGLGWRVSLGALGLPSMASPPVCVSPDAVTGGSYATYEAPDGSQHVFYATLHPGDPDDSFNGVQDSVSTATENVAYTRDGTYLRLKRYSGYEEIELPEGTVHRFDANGRIIQMRDPFGNQVNIAYPAAGGCTGALSNETSCWQITDSQGRTQWIYFRSDLPVYNGVPPYGALVNRVVLTAFGGAPAQAVYQFNYEVATVRRSCPNSGIIYGPIAVPLLLSVTQPDGSSFAPGAGGYLQTPGSDCLLGSASLTSLTLPTLGSIAWSYGTYAFPNSSTSRPRLTSNQGVFTRTTKDALGNTIGQWTYATSLATLTSPQLVNTVTDPLGNQHVRYFSVSTSTSYGPGANQYDYGRQYTPVTSYTPATTIYAGPPLPLYLSEQVIDATGKVWRTEYVRYERDVVDTSLGIPDFFNNNPRIGQRETFYDDGAQGGYTDADFDGVGHYRWHQTDGTFAGNNKRIEKHNYNPNRWTYHAVQSTNSLDATYNYLPPTDPWVLNTQQYEFSWENYVSELRSFCYDTTTGFLKRRRLYVQSATDPSATSAADVIQVFTPDAGGTGNLASEQYFGGDGNPITPTSSDLCAQTLTGSPEYQISHGYAYGVNSVTQYVGTGFYSKYLGIDPSTGLPNYSRDTAGIQTNFTHDAMGRLTYVLPRDGAWTQYLYHPASSPSSLASLTVDRQQNGSPSVSLAQTKSFYDALGRPTEQDVRMPDGTWSARTTSYNALGWKKAVSEQGSPNVHVTQYLNYDPFGRAGTIRPPDSTGNHDVTMSYFGVQKVNRTVSVGTSWTGSSVAESPSTTTETYDLFGRLASVTEPSGSGGAGTITSYQYEPGNRLSQVQTTSGSTTQTRLFTYDHRGFLGWEQHPETSPNTLGAGHHKDYLGYDSRGHFHRTVEGANDLSYTYDVAERPLLVYNTLYGANCNPSPITTPTCVKQFSYDNVSAGALGRLYQASRFNHILFGGTPYVDEWTYTYTYGYPDGRVSQRTLQHAFNGSTTTGQESFAQSWTYTQLGKIDTETYPNCAPTFGNCAGTLGRAVQNLYSNGFLTGVNGYTSGAGITYYPNGMVSSVTHGNGVMATYGLDPNGMPRPASITANGPANAGSPALWNSGYYGYDGSGNVIKVGQGYYLYDGVSRLVTANVETNALNNANPALDSFSYQTTAYDAFGNIQGFSTNSTPTDPATNHLSGSTYDASGNLRAWQGPPPSYVSATYDFDELNQLKHYKNGTQEWYYMYDADDERVWSFQPPVNGLSRFDRWTLRGLDGKVRRTFELYGYAWSNSWGGSNLWEDHVYRDGTLLAGFSSIGYQRHMDVDHLGTPRLITNVVGNQNAYHVYLPYGVEATPFNQDGDRMKFTGHERDLADPTSPADDLDYMHARHFSPVTGRFLRIDTLQGKPKRPQTWNRYAYAAGNPLRYVDPNGKEVVEATFRAFIPQASVAGFSGDNRGFSSDKNASSRTSITVRVETDPAKRGGSNPLLSPPDVKIGPTHFADGSGGKTSNGPLLPLAAGFYDAQGNTVIAIQENARNPYVSIGSGISADVALTIPQNASTISVTGDISRSPSFELNVSVNGGSPENIPLQTASDNSFFFALDLQLTTELNDTTLLQPMPPQ
jgi:RHS repeat-associated protein